MNSSLEQDSLYGAMPQEAPQAQMTVVARTGLPPLRFKGWRAAHCINSETGFFVDLWARKKGDYVVAHSDIQSAAANAVVAPNPDAAADYLENLCHAALTPPITKELTLTLQAVVTKRDAQRKFAILVGEALAQWDRHGFLNLTPTPERSLNHANG